MENRNGLLTEFALEPADGYAERKSARAMAAAYNLLRIARLSPAPA